MYTVGLGSNHTVGWLKNKIFVVDVVTDVVVARIYFFNCHL